MSHGAIPQVDAMVIEQAVLTGDLQVIGRSQGEDR
jgi:hypothetical protein